MVVVWCRNQKIYNVPEKYLDKRLLWFDVGIKRYTTRHGAEHDEWLLWFDVGIKRYTTNPDGSPINPKLWFDVGIKRYTTYLYICNRLGSCGLM